MKMDELTKLVADRTGISEAQARQAVEIVLGQLKTRLPGGMGGQIDQFLAGGGGGGANLGEVAKGLGGMLGRR